MFAAAKKHIKIGFQITMQCYNTDLPSIEVHSEMSDIPSGKWIRWWGHKVVSRWSEEANLDRIADHGAMVHNGPLTHRPPLIHV